MKKAVNAAALGIQGSGWAWLGYNPTTKKVSIELSLRKLTRFETDLLIASDFSKLI